MTGGLAATVFASVVCAADAPAPAGVLSSYDGMAPAHTVQTRALWKGDPDALAEVKTVRIAPVKIAPGADDRVTPAERGLVVNEMARTLCARLSGHFRVVPSRARERT